MGKPLPEYVYEQESQALTHGNLARAECFNNNDVVQPANLNMQPSWDILLCGKTYKELLMKQDCPGEKARLLAEASGHSSDWPDVVPVPTLDLKLDR